MTKPLAILGDSMREAKDSKVLLVMLIFSALILLLLASIGYHPVPPEEVLAKVKSDFPEVQMNHGKDPVIIRRRVQYEVTDFHEARAASNPAEGRYTFTVKATPQAAGEDDEADDEDGPRRNRPKKKKDAVKAAAKDEAKKDEAKKDEAKKDEAKKDEKKEPAKKDPNDLGEGDAFTQSIIIWNVELGELAKVIRQTQRMGEDAPLPDMKYPINHGLMEDFIREKLEFHYNVRVVECHRKPAPLLGPQEFTVTIDGSDPRAWPHNVSFLFGAWTPKGLQRPLGVIVWAIEDNLINGWGAGIAILVGIIITAFFIPEMLRKGAIDLLLAKPISRFSLLFWKYVGGLSFMLILATVNVGGAWLVLGLRSGVWNPKFLLAIPLLVFSFAVLYAVSTLVAMLTRSAVVSILVTCLFAGFLYIVGQAYAVYDVLNNTPGMKEEIPGWVHTTADIVHGVLPRTKDLDKISSKLIAEVMTEADQRRNMLHLVSYPSWGATFAVSAIWIAVLLGLASWRFVKRDY
jgi:ABC-type transport system involved in multi-copper enzyme maturation permease subunit